MDDRSLAEALGEENMATGEARRKAGRLLAEAEVGFLGLSDDTGPYVVPLSFAYDGEDVYFHGGSGKKARAIAADPRACLAVTGPPSLVKGDDACSDNFQCASVLVWGRVAPLASPQEKDAALRTIVAKYHPEVAADPLDPKKVAGTDVYRMEILAVTYRELPGD